MEFTISRAYEGLSKVECQDLLEAVQVTYNIEGDLYYRGELIVSCMGYSGMRNRKNLKRLGIEMIIINNHIRFKWLEEYKNKEAYYANIIDLKRIGMGDKAEIHVSDCKRLESDIRFDSLDSIRPYMEDLFSNYKSVDILISFNSVHGHQYL
ncbi:hypothetical protein [Bacillus cereus]|jgi:hypothetical protein|uniref:hypothetical protein n=1 Tax=Bacillus cereus group TaxID=86661 RepID=UPI000978321E|nr:hypothetical protein [Bacillus cereus]MBF8118929.1 hypothetical protein [Bacillus cereus]ONG72113.1 hypothetical protein BKK44_10010 [Bacillus cereus]